MNAHPCLAQRVGRHAKALLYYPTARVSIGHGKSAGEQKMRKMNSSKPTADSPFEGMSDTCVTFYLQHIAMERLKPQLTSPAVEALARRVADWDAKIMRKKGKRPADIAYCFEFIGIFHRIKAKLGVTIEHIRKVVKGKVQDALVSAELEREIRRQFPLFRTQALVFTKTAV
jgi:hypothetical protein